MCFKYLNLLRNIGIGVSYSILMQIFKSSKWVESSFFILNYLNEILNFQRPYATVLGNIADTELYKDIKLYKDVRF